eukprot:m.17865 g.17865  ORF g.17865 m.17865 type:complete len:115 (-) comp7600_c0_seq1:36-380(-)
MSERKASNIDVRVQCANTDATMQSTQHYDESGRYFTATVRLDELKRVQTHTHTHTGIQLLCACLAMSLRHQMCVCVLLPLIPPASRCLPKSHQHTYTHSHAHSHAQSHPFCATT